MKEIKGLDQYHQIKNQLSLLTLQESLCCQRRRLRRKYRNYGLLEVGEGTYGYPLLHRYCINELKQIRCHRYATWVVTSVTFKWQINELYIDYITPDKWNIICSCRELNGRKVLEFCKMVETRFPVHEFFSTSWICRHCSQCGRLPRPKVDPSWVPVRCFFNSCICP